MRRMIPFYSAFAEFNRGVSLLIFKADFFDFGNDMEKRRNGVRWQLCS